MFDNAWFDLFEEGSYTKTYSYYGSSANGAEGFGDGVVTGYGVIDSRCVFTSFSDSSFLGGSFGSIYIDKIIANINLAFKKGLPYIFFLNTKGTRVSEGHSVLSAYSRLIKCVSECSGKIPLICVIDGDCVGIVSTFVSLFDFVCMTNGTGVVTASPVRSGKINKDNLGKCFHASQSGLCSFAADSTEDMKKIILHLLSFIPDSCESGAPDYDGTTDDPERFVNVSDGSDSVDSLKVIKEAVDDNDFLEIRKDFAPNIITGFGRFGGRVCGIVANQAAVNSGLIDSSACAKAISLINFCSAYSVPVITFVSSEGVISSAEEEAQGLTEMTGALSYAYAVSEVNQLTVIIGNAFGSASVIMNSRGLGCDYVYAWSDAKIGLVTPDTGALLEFGDIISEADDPVSARTDAESRFLKEYSSPVIAAAKGYVDEVIEPGETRARIISFINLN